jgi:hypothetical protein
MAIHGAGPVVAANYTPGRRRLAVRAVEGTVWR